MLSFTDIIISALIYTGALAWNEFFKSAIKSVSPLDTNGKTILVTLFYALFVTLCIFIVYQFYIRVKLEIEKHSEPKADDVEDKVRKVVITGIDPKVLKDLNKDIKDSPKNQRLTGLAKIVKI